ncbi:MAG: hypothetical protein QMD71_00690 [bacterium]|nr:hypothetical protein [bacterium]
MGLLTTISEESPVILFLDNLHLVDEASLSLLHYLVQNIHIFRILIFGVIREATRTELSDIIKLSKEIQLQLLSITELSKMIQEIASLSLAMTIKIKEI